MKLMNDEFGFVILVLIIAALPAAISVITLFVKLIGFFRNVFSGETEYEATVLKKAHNTEYRNNRTASGYNFPYKLDIYFVTYRTPKHKKLKVKVDNKDYYAAGEGDTGILTLKGSKFISFKKICTIPTDSEGSEFG